LYYFTTLGDDRKFKEYYKFVTIDVGTHGENNDGAIR
jgi:hypothetical protein